MKLNTDPLIPPELSPEQVEKKRENVKAELKAIEEQIHESFDILSALIHDWFFLQGFWESSNTGEKLMLMCSEVAEAMEADRKDLPSDKIEGFTGVEEELADVIVRVFDFAGRHNLRLSAAFLAKMEMNLSRPFKHGKKY